MLASGVIAQCETLVPRVVFVRSCALVPAPCFAAVTRFAQQFHTMSFQDEDKAPSPRPLFAISGATTVALHPNGSRSVSVASKLWREAFYIDPETGVITTFGRLDAIEFQEVILTIQVWTCVPNCNLEGCLASVTIKPMLLCF